MENQSNQATKKGIILLLGIIIGLLTGVLVAFIVESKIKPKSTSVVKVISPEKTPSSWTTIPWTTCWKTRTTNMTSGKAQQ